MEIFKRYVMLCIGLMIVAFGVAFSILADLGTSPISCPPYVASMLCSLTVGEATIVMHCIFILIQMALLRKDYDWVQLMQLPVAFVFGYMTDFACWCIADVPCPNCRGDRRDVRLLQTSLSQVEYLRLERAAGDNLANSLKTDK